MNFGGELQQQLQNRNCDFTTKATSRYICELIQYLCLIKINKRHFRILLRHTGALISFLQKGLQYVEIESHLSEVMSSNERLVTMLFVFIVCMLVYCLDRTNLIIAVITTRFSGRC